MNKQKWRIFNRNTQSFIDQQEPISSLFASADAFDIYSTVPEHATESQASPRKHLTNHNKTRDITPYCISEHLLFLSKNGQKIHDSSLSVSHYLVKYIAPIGSAFDVASFSSHTSFRIEQYADWILDSTLLCQCRL